MRLSACVLAIAVLSPVAARAQTPAEATPPPPAPPPPPPPPAAVVVAVPPAPAPAPAAAPAKTWKDLVTLEGLVDTYYLWNFTGTTSTTPPGSRQFDTNSNAFTLNYAKVGIGLNADPVGLRLDLGYGATGAIINAANPYPPQLSSEAFVVQQAYATISPVTNLTLDFGKFVTTAGAEVIEANKNWIYSRSFLFFNIPLLHTGVRATYKVSDLLTLQASVTNGWNGTGVGGDITGAKTYGVSASVTLPVGTSIIGTGYFGKGEPFTTPAGVVASTDTRILGDLVVAQTFGNLGLNLNVDYVNDKNAGIDGFIGVAAMAHFVLDEHLAVSGRFEYAREGDAAHTKFLEGTASLGVPFGGRFEFRAEFRGDHTNTATFDPDAMGAPQDKTQFTGTGAFLAWF